MRRRAFLVAVVVGVVVVGALVAAGLSPRGGAVAATTQPPAVFVAKFPQIGTVYMRSYCARARSTRFALGIHYSSQSGVARFRAGRFSRDREVQPSNPTSWFPYRPNRVQWLAAAAGGENGVVVGWVRVVGYSIQKSCDAVYDPPRVTVQIYPRCLNYDENSSRYLRQLIG